MIVVQGSAAVSNIDERHAFTIKANAKAFKLLSSNLYSDKPLAIMRELGCNALDSHTAAGWPEKPFKVVLPSDMHPWVEIIDYGTGLNDDEVKNIFTTYFESTKTTSNDYIGAMGLGSKSPFSYTDAFEVYARQNGVENHYTCFLNKNGAPELFLIETLTDSSFVNGVTIKVPVKSQDYHVFRNAAAKAYRFFPVKPVIGTSTNPVNFEQPNYGFEGSNFKVIKGDGQSYALMGPVAYPLDLKQFKHDGFMQQHMSKGLGGFLITFPIGELDVNAGREGLSYDEVTIANIEKGIAHIRVEMAKKLQDEMDLQPNKWAAINFRAKNDSNDLFKLTYKGDKLNGLLTYSILDETITTGESVPLFQIKETSTRYVEKLKDSRRTDSLSINPTGGYRVLLIDDTKKYVKKIRYADPQEQMDKMAILVPTSAQHFTGKDAFADLVKKFDVDGVPYRWISDVKDNIPKVERVKADPSAPKPAAIYSGFYKYDRPYGVMVVRNLPNLDQTDMDAKAAYILWDAKSKRYTIGGKILATYDVSSTIWSLIEDAAKKANLPLVVVTPKVNDQIPKHWVDVSDVLRGNIIQSISEEAFRKCTSEWIHTLLKMKDTEYASVLSNPKVNPFFKKLGDHIRSIKFGQAYDHTTTRFFELVYGISSEVDEGPLKYLQNINSTLFSNRIVVKAAERYYSRWPTDEFSDSLILFSSLLAYGTIDEKKLNDYLNTK